MKHDIYQLYSQHFNGIMEIYRHFGVNYTCNYDFHTIKTMKWIDKILGTNIEETSAMSFFKISDLRT